MDIEGQQAQNLLLLSVFRKGGGKKTGHGIPGTLCVGKTEDSAGKCRKGKRTLSGRPNQLFIRLRSFRIIFPELFRAGESREGPQTARIVFRHSGQDPADDGQRLRVSPLQDPQIGLPHRKRE